MIKKTIIITVLILFCLSAGAQTTKQNEVLKREVTLYNPYKPSLTETRKRSYLPDMNDTIKIRPQFSYEVNSEPFMPAYTISPLKAASILPDPLPKLYKSYVNLGLGNYISPLAEISITNERSKNGTIGLYARHFSTNGKVKLQNEEKIFAGYMDNDASLFGKKFFKKSQIESSVDLTQRTRYAYGYDPLVDDYSPEKKDIRLDYFNIGTKASLSSMTLDSTNFCYDFDIHYNYFHNIKTQYQHNIGINGTVAKSFKGFYVGSSVSYDYYGLSDSITTEPEYIASISPFIKKSTDQWSFKLGLLAMIDKNADPSSEFHLYPDLNFGFSVVPSYINFFAALSGKLERNKPLNIIQDNPFLNGDGTLFKLPDTDHEMIVKAGLRGNTGLNGNYLVSVSYSIISDMLFYSNDRFSETVAKLGNGNYFTTFTDDADLLNIHAEMNGSVCNNITFAGGANYYKYSLATYDHAWNRPDWDLNMGLKYNLRDKIIAGMQMTAIGKRQLVVNGQNLNPLIDVIPDPEESIVFVESPAHFNVNLSAEYRYSKILSFWIKANNLAYNKYYEWAYYPTQRFLCMLGFTYSL
jgi:hypothetical protein